MSAKEIHSTVIFQHLVRKEFAEEVLLCQEALGTMLASLVGMTDQRMIFDSSGLMLEKVSGVTLSNLSEQINDDLKQTIYRELAKKMLKIKDSFHKKEELISCALGTLGYKNLLKKNENSIIEVGGQELFDELSKFSKEKMTVCHGDLNMSNLLLSGSQITLVDFEHVTIAPISFEMGSAILFDDSKSLNVSVLVVELSRLGLVISQKDLLLGAKLYLADQLTKSDKAKKAELLKLAKKQKLI